MPILDGESSAAALPPAVVTILNDYGDELARVAVLRQQAESVAIAELLGLVVVTDNEENAGIALASDVTAGLLATCPPNDRPKLQKFLSSQVPATHLRVVVWEPTGVTLVRVDTLQPTKGGQA